MNPKAVQVLNEYVAAGFLTEEQRLRMLRMWHQRAGLIAQDKRRTR